MVTLQLPPGEMLSRTEQVAFGLETGQPAVASDVLAARGRLLTTLQEEGHPFADVGQPTAYLRPASRTLST